METLTFVLGALSGLFLIGIVYAFLGVLNMQQEVKKLRADLTRNESNYKDDLDQIYRDITQVKEDMVNELNHVRQNLGQEVLELYRRTDVIEDLHNENKKLYQYIDSRIDKTADALITRMDVRLFQKEEGMLKS